MTQLLVFKWMVSEKCIVERAVAFFSNISIVEYIRHYPISEKILLNASFFGTPSSISAEHFYALQLGVAPMYESEIENLFFKAGKELTQDPERWAIVLQKFFIDVKVIALN